MIHDTLTDVPQILKDVCTYVLDKKNRADWKEDYRKIIEYFNRVEPRGISAAWFNWAKSTDRLLRTNRMQLKDIKKLKGNDSSNPTWAYIIYLSVHM